MAKVTDISEKALMSISEVMAYLSIGRNMTLRLLQDAPFTVRIGRRVFAHREGLDAWLRQGGNCRNQK
ncbi:MAG: helix-turn-helix domain-containing protein [Clostridiaceae bacterium]|nr:helix-turn-helix domain-containing protein [Clostridiaceae bacterium]